MEKVYAKRKTKLKGAKFARIPTIMIGGNACGGGKTNTIPERFTFSIDRRLLPEEKVSKVKAEFMQVIKRAQRKDKQLKVKVEYPLMVESGSTPEDAVICQTAKQAWKSITGETSRFAMSGGFTDMHFLTNNAKVPTVGLGVKGGGAHSDLEFADVNSILKTTELYAEIAMRMPS